MDVHSPDWPLRDVVDDVLSLVDIAAKPSRVGILESHSLHREGCRKYQSKTPQTQFEEEA